MLGWQELRRRCKRHLEHNIDTVIQVTHEINFLLLDDFLHHLQEFYFLCFLAYWILMWMAPNRLNYVDYDQNKVWQLFLPCESTYEQMNDVAKGFKLSSRRTKLFAASDLSLSARRWSTNGVSFDQVSNSFCIFLLDLRMSPLKNDISLNIQRWFLLRH